MLKYSVKKGRSLNFTEGMAEKDESDALEENAMAYTETPEDINSFAEMLKYGQK